MAREEEWGGAIDASQRAELGSPTRGGALPGHEGGAKKRVVGLRRTENTTERRSLRRKDC